MTDTPASAPWDRAAEEIHQRIWEEENDADSGFPISDRLPEDEIADIIKRCMGEAVAEKDRRIAELEQFAKRTYPFLKSTVLKHGLWESARGFEDEAIKLGLLDKEATPCRET